MARVRITWLGTGSEYDMPVFPFGRYQLPKGVPVEVGDDIIPAKTLLEDNRFRVETIEE